MQYGYVHLFVNYSIQFVSVLSNTIPINPVEILYGNGSKTMQECLCARAHNRQILS